MHKSIGYLVSEYPAPSHTFIRREVEVLRQKGLRIETFSIRKPGGHARFNEYDMEPLKTTKYLLPVSFLMVLRCHLRSIMTQPLAYLKTLAWGLGHTTPGISARISALLYFAEAVVLATMMNEAGVRHIHNHFANASARVGIMTSKLLGVTWSVTLHGSADWAFPNGYLLPEKIKVAAFVACVSHYTRAQAMWVSEMSQWEKMFISHCGVNVRAIAEHSGRIKVQRDIFRVITVGRLSPEKGQTGLLQAFAALLERGLNIELRIVGDGPSRPYLEKMIRQLGIGDKCKLLGQMTELEVMAELVNSDLFVLSSFMEGLPVVLMEALAMRVPSIAPCIAGIPELIQDGVTGLLFPPGDWEGLAEKMERIIRNPSLRASLSEQGFDVVSRYFDIKFVTNQLELNLKAAVSQTFLGR